MGIALETLALIKVQCALRKTTLAIVPNEIDRLYYQRIMKDWPEEYRALVTIQTSSEIRVEPYPKPAPLVCLDESTELTKEQLEFLANRRQEAPAATERV